MPEYDPERLEVADGLRRQLAIENELSRPQARAFVRCLQTSWQVQTIQWTERDSNGQLSDARRLLHAAHVFREIDRKSVGWGNSVSVGVNLGGGREHKKKKTQKQ